MGDTPPMTQEQEEEAVPLGSNTEHAITSQLINKVERKKTKVKEINNWMSPKGLRQLTGNLNDKEKKAAKKLGLRAS